MARLPSGDYLIQCLADGSTCLFEDHTEREIARFDPDDPAHLWSALADIQASELTSEDKAFACFWAGYFYAHNTHQGDNSDPAQDRK
jgi:hypothetical protein